MSNEKTEIVTAICDLLKADKKDEAADLAKSRYPFSPPPEPARKSQSNRLKVRVFFTDGFTCRYSGKRLFFPGVLDLLCHVLPNEFPYHPNWKTSECHAIYSEFYPMLDHVVPISRGGADDETNLVTTCNMRNDAKSNWTLEELGWQLHPPGDINQWDGMTAWFMSYIEDHQALMEIKKLASWYRAAKFVISERRS